jgi:hypothetical protein
MKRASISLIAILAILFLGFSNTSRTVDSKYRWHHEYAPSSGVPASIRFPNKGSGSNVIPAFGLGRQVDFLQIAYSGASGTGIDWVVYSAAFPAGADTTRTNNIFRTFTLSGVAVDSLVQLASTNTERCYIDAAGGQ